MIEATELSAQRRLVQALMARLPGPAEGLETHISFVLLAGGFAYKIKKAVNLGFVDYTSLARRHFFCEEELRLNRRLAPTLYLDALPLYGSVDAPAFEGEGEPIEWCVKMRRFEQARRLDQVLATGELAPERVEAFGRRLAAFHEAIPRASLNSAFGSPETIGSAVSALLDALPASPELSALARWFSETRAQLQPRFRQRKAEGFVRECHGDLHLANLVLEGDEIIAFDGIEFSPELRWVDVMSELAFPFMDLCAHGRAVLANRLLNAWLAETGDHAGLALLRFYAVYRALVRARVAQLMAERETEAQARKLSEMKTYLAQAQALASPPPLALLITHGFSGSGKTTLARSVAQALGAICLRSDVERKRLHQLKPLARSASGLDSGLYTEAANRQTYARLVELAESILAAGYPVIIDAACLKRWEREAFQRLAEKRGIPFLILACQAPLDMLSERIEARSRRGDDASEAGLEVLSRQVGSAEALSPQELGLSEGVDTDLDSGKEILKRILKRLGRIE